MLNNIRIVLCGTTHAGNIGAAARAMKTMGLERLVLVSPREYPSAEATARASGADDILAAALVFEGIDEALADVHFVIGTSARLRRIPLPQHDPSEAAQRIVEKGDQEVAVLFGRERTGLTNREMNRCHALLHIPGNPEYGSLNLAAAVQVVCYELRMKGLATGQGSTPAMPAHVPAPRQQMEGLFSHLEQALLDIEFLDPQQSTAMMQRLRRLVHRMAPDETEIHILRGILSRAQRAAGKQPP